MLPEESNRELEDIAFELTSKASSLAGQVNPTVTLSIGNLVRSMNCYYSNLSFSDVVNMHYQRNRFVRQDVFSTGGLPKSHFLKYTMTPEDQQLDAIDSTIKFGR